MSETAINYQEEIKRCIDKVLVKKTDTKFYVCSLDYNIVSEIFPKNKELFDRISNISGVYLKKSNDPKKWELESENPYILIV